MEKLKLKEEMERIEKEIHEVRDQYKFIKINYENL